MARNSDIGLRTRLPASDYPHHELAHETIGAAFRVHSVLGYGFLESVYRRALVTELGRRGLSAKQEQLFEVDYEGVTVGIYSADLVVESTVIVEVKAGLYLDPAAMPQALNYLRASGLSVGLILHFGLRADVKRVVTPRAEPNAIATESIANTDKGQ